MTNRYFVESNEYPGHYEVLDEFLESETRYITDDLLQRESANYYITRSELAEIERNPKYHTSHLTQDTVKVGAYTDKLPDNVRIMPPGIYKTVKVGYSTYLKVHDNSDINYVLLDCYKEHYDYIHESIKNFKDKDEVYKEHGLLKKRSYLLYGEPGNGKTSLILDILREYKKSAYIFIDFPYNDTEWAAALTSISDNAVKIFIFEELLTHTENPAAVPVFLNFLDGLTKIDLSLFISTTNYPEKLPGNIVDRPGRFDRLINFGTPKLKDRIDYLEKLLKRQLDEDEVSILEKSDYSIAYLQEMGHQMLINDKTLGEVQEEIDGRKRLIKNTFCESKGGLGFHAN